MKIFTYESNAFASVTYILSDDAGTASVIIDPSVDEDGVKARFPSLPPISAVLLTHGHFDHTLALDSYAEAKIPVYMSHDDVCMLGDGYKNASFVFFGKETVHTGADIREVTDGDKISVGREYVTVIATPGHTKGSLSYLCRGAVFSGDTIFEGGGYGRTDLYSGSYDELILSIGKLLLLDGNVTVYPGHGTITTIANEKKYYK